MSRGLLLHRFSCARTHKHLGLVRQQRQRPPVSVAHTRHTHHRTLHEHVATLQHCDHNSDRAQSGGHSRRHVSWHAVTNHQQILVQLTGANHAVLQVRTILQQVLELLQLTVVDARHCLVVAVAFGQLAQAR